MQAPLVLTINLFHVPCPKLGTKSDLHLLAPTVVAESCHCQFTFLVKLCLGCCQPDIETRRVPCPIPMSCSAHETLPLVYMRAGLETWHVSVGPTSSLNGRSRARARSHKLNTHTYIHTRTHTYTRAPPPLPPLKHTYTRTQPTLKLPLKFLVLLRKKSAEVEEGGASSCVPVIQCAV
eukprot:1153316-Pelagomonas_calceolata.AAC.10